MECTKRKRVFMVLLHKRWLSWMGDLNCCL